MIEVKFHPEAAAALKHRAQEIFSRMRLFAPEELKIPKADFKPDIEVAARLTEKDIAGKISFERIDTATGAVEKVVIETDKGPAGVEGETCFLLGSLVDQAIKSGRLGQVVSQEFVRTHTKEWLRLRFEGQSELDFPLYLSTAVQDAVSELEAWVPIAFLSIESDFMLGEVTFRTITREVLDHWFEHRRASVPAEHRSALEEHLKKERQRLQGLAAATLNLQAEAEFAATRAIEIADDIVSYLDIFHVANLAPRLTCYTRPLGREYVPSYRLFLQRPSGGVGERRSVLLPPPERWEISNLHLSEFRNMGLARLNEMLSSSARSEFQDKLLDVLLIYSRNSLEREPVEKLIYILVSLESMLLKDQLEPIQQNVGERLAFAVGSSASERQQIVALVRTCYDFRSKYLHHGFNRTSLDEIARLMKYAWVFFCLLIRSHDHYESKRALVEALDARKFE